MTRAFWAGVVLALLTNNDLAFVHLNDALRNIVLTIRRLDIRSFNLQIRRWLFIVSDEAERSC